MHSLRDHLFVIPLPWNEIADVFLLGGYVAGEIYYCNSIWYTSHNSIVLCENSNCFDNRYSLFLLPLLIHLKAKVLAQLSKVVHLC